MELNIHPGVVVLWIVAAMSVWGVLKALSEGEVFGAFVMLCMAVGAGWWGYYEAKPETEQMRIAEKQREKEDQIRRETPHIIREADGCKVYAFESGGRWHYFTRCPGDRTVTDTSYEQCSGSGKTRRCWEEHSSMEVK